MNRKQMDVRGCCKRLSMTEGRMNKVRIAFFQMNERTDISIIIPIYFSFLPVVYKHTNSFLHSLHILSDVKHTAMVGMHFLCPVVFQTL